MLKIMLVCMCTNYRVNKSFNANACDDNCHQNMMYGLVESPTNKNVSTDANNTNVDYSTCNSLFDYECSQTTTCDQESEYDRLNWTHKLKCGHNDAAVLGNSINNYDKLNNKI